MQNKPDSWPIIFELFQDPTSGQKFEYASEKETLIAGEISIPCNEGIVDFYFPNYGDSKHDNAEDVTSYSAPEAFEDKLDEQIIDSAPELRESYDNAFAAEEDSGGNIYGSLEDSSSITQSGHYTRMEILNSFDLGDIENKVAVDFGTGPWGFGAIFENLQKAGTCIGFDVSAVALNMARRATPSDRNSNTVFATSDGEKIPLRDSTVDIFFGGEVIEHVRNPALFMQEIARVCKNDAIVILTTPNRDALYYRLHGLEYAVGPEHIALLNCEEFRSILETFSSDIEIAGYETSIGAFEDGLEVSKSELDLFQARSRRYPQLASGLISFSRVNKSNYLRHKKDLVLREIHNASAAVNYSNEPSEAQLHGPIYGSRLSKDSELQVPIFGQYIALLFWGHDWGGYVEIEWGEQKLQKNLYSKFGGFIRVEFENLNSANSLTIRTTGKCDARSHDSQVIFYKLIDYHEAP